MAGLDLSMSIINLIPMAVESAETSVPPATATEPAFVSQQVREARRYYLDLNPRRTDSLVLVCGGVERMRQDYVVERKNFPYYAIEMVSEGEGTLTLGDRTFALSAGSIFAYGPKTPHRIENKSRDGMRKYYVDIAGRNAKGLLVSAGLLTSTNVSGEGPLHVTSLHELVDLFETLDREARDEGSLTQDICGAVLRTLCLKIRQRSVIEGGKVPRSYETYAEVRRHIDDNFLHLSTASQIAKRCGITPIYLSRLFAKFAGVGAYQFLLRKKMNFAAELLMEEGMLVKEVAEQLDYADAFQFSRAFKRVYGVPPNRLIHRRR